MEGPTFAVQMATATKLYLAEVPKDGSNKGMYDSREGGAEWKEVEIPKTDFDGFFGGVAPLYEGIAKGKGKDEVSVLINQRLPCSKANRCLGNAHRESWISMKRSQDTRCWRRLRRARKRAQGNRTFEGFLD